MKIEHVYLAFCVLGTLLPLSQFIPWLMAHGLDLALIWTSVTGDRLSAFAWADVIISAMVLICFVLVEGRHTGMKHLWAPIVAVMTVGVSLALPLFLLMRHRHLADQAA